MKADTFKDLFEHVFVQKENENVKSLKTISELYVERRKMAQRYIFLHFLKEFRKKTFLCRNISFLYKNEKNKLIDIAEQMNINFTLSEEDAIFGFGKYGKHYVKATNVLKALGVKHNKSEHQDLVSLENISETKNVLIKEYIVNLDSIGKKYGLE